MTQCLLIHFLLKWNLLRCLTQLLNGQHLWVTTRDLRVSPGPGPGPGPSCAVFHVLSVPLCVLLQLQLPPIRNSNLPVGVNVNSCLGIDSSKSDSDWRISWMFGHVAISHISKEIVECVWKGSFKSSWLTDPVAQLVLTVAHLGPEMAGMAPAHWGTGESGCRKWTNVFCTFPRI